MLKKSCLLPFICLVGFLACAMFKPQSAIAQEQKRLELFKNINCSKAVEDLILSHQLYYKSYPLQGYRILIFSQSGNNSSNAALNAKEIFDFLYTDMPTYISYEAPYYKVKTGNFRTRFEASSFLKYIRLDYPNAFVVKEAIDIPYILNLTGNENMQEESMQEESMQEENAENKTNIIPSADTIKSIPNYNKYD